MIPLFRFKALKVINKKPDLLVFLILLIFLSSLSAQEISDPPQPFPRVALVLSGGAALGIAHVGVLKVLEEIGIPLDLVVGNSMGSLVGGLYAAGYSPGDMEELVARINWNWLFNQTDSYGGSRLIDTDNQILTLEFDKYGVAGSNGLIDDRKIYAMLSRLTYRVSMVDSFDRLPLPFRTVAVNLEDGTQEVFHDGPLALAMRASMSIPVIFPPVPAENGLLVDGGVLNNNPVDLALAWGADIIIEVNVENFRQAEPANLSTVSDVANQTLKILLNFSAASRDGRGTARITIEPDLVDFSRLDFFRSPELAQRGEEAARSQWDALTALGEEISRYRSLKKQDWRRRGRYFFIAEPVFDSVRLSPPGRLSEATLNRIFKDLLGGEADQERLEQCVEEVVRLGGYSFLYYYLERKPRGKLELVLSGEPAKHRAHELLVGVNFNGVAGTHNGMEAEAQFSLNLQDLTGPGSDWQNRLVYFINEGAEASFSYKQPVFSFLSVQPSLEGRFRYSRVSPFTRDEELSSYFSLAAGLGLKFDFIDWWDFDMGYRFSQKWYNRFENSGDTGVTLEEPFRQWLNLHTVCVGTSWDASAVNPFSRVSFRGGFMARIPFAGSGLPDPPVFPWFDELIISHRQLHTPSEKRTFYFDAVLHSYRGAVASPWDLLTLSGMDGIPGYVSDADFRGRDKFILGAGYLENLPLLTNYTGFDTFFSLVLRVGNVWESWKSWDDLNQLKYGIGAGVEMQTNIGILSLGLGVAMDRTWAIYLYFE